MPAHRRARSFAKDKEAEPLSPTNTVAKAGCGLRSLALLRLLGGRRRRDRRNSHINSEQGPNASVPSSFSTPKVILLPTEIVAQIFLRLAIDPSKRPTLTPNPKPFRESVQQPLALSQVCRHWRYVALGVPILWSSVHITRYLHPNLLQLFLQRTQGFPLAVTIDSTRHKLEAPLNNDSVPQQQHSLYLFQRALPASQQSRIIRCMMLLRKHAIHRCLKIDATLDTIAAFAFMDLMSLPNVTQSRSGHGQGGGLQLTEISVRMTDRTASSALLLYHVQDCLHTAALSTPSLRTLRWESERPLSVQKDIILHPIWSQLKTIHIRTKMSGRDAALMLQICRAATEVRIHEITPSRESPHFRQRNRAQGQQITVLPNLRTLYLGQSPGAASSNCVRVLRRFKLPSLRSLKIHPFIATDQSCRIVEKMLCRSFTAETIDKSPSVMAASGENDASILRLLCIPPLLRDKLSYSVRGGSLSLYFTGTIKR